MLLSWVVIIIGGLVVALMGSRRAVQHASALAIGLKVPPFLMGITFLALGTDLPEIANSIVASLANHGDINVGDSIGSAATQITLILGLLPLIGGAFVVGRTRAALVGAVTLAALGLGALLAADGFLSRLDGFALVMTWVGGSAFVWAYRPEFSEPSLTIPAHRKGYHALAALFSLAVVGAGSTAAISAFIQLTTLLGVPEYYLSFFAISLGTSLPELLVNITAIRSGERDLAVGDVLGATMVDSSLSIGIGPLVSPTGVTASLAIRGALTTMGVVALAILILSLARRHDWRTGVALIILYLGVYVVLLGT